MLNLERRNILWNMMLSIIFVLLIQHSINGELDFFTIFGEEGEFVGKSIRETIDGNYILCGTTRADLGSQYNFFLSKIDGSGIPIWTNTIGGSSGDHCYSVIETSDGYVVGGTTSSFGSIDTELLITKVNLDGSHDWTMLMKGIDVQYSANLQFLESVNDGGFVTVVSSGSLGPGSSSGLLTRHSPNGTLLWATSFGGTGVEYAQSVQETSDGYFIVTGGTTSYSIGSHDVFVSKFNGDGSHEWTTTFGGPGDDRGYSIVEDPSDGGFVVAGTSDSYGPDEFSLIIAKLTSSGSVNWVYAYGGEQGSDVAYSIESVSSGYVVAGSSSNDVFLLKVDLGGDMVWNRYRDELNTDVVYFVRKTSTDGLILTGSTQSYSATTNHLLLSYFEEDGECWDSLTFEREECGGISIVSQTPTIDDVRSSIVIETPVPTILPIPLEEVLICGSCFGVSVENLQGVCSGHGSCIGPGDYFGESCDVTTCFNVSSNISDHVCSGHGDCEALSDTGYTTSFCSVWYCGGTIYSSEYVCSGSGSCVSPEKCVCEENYLGFLCENFLCYGVEQESEDVCSGHGICVQPDSCECTGNYEGDECDYNKNLAVGLGVSLPLITIFSVGTGVVCLVFSVCCVFFVVCGVSSSVCLVCLWGGSKLVSQRKKLSKFGLLKDFDLLLREQEMEEAGDYAKLRINKSLYQVEFDDVKTLQILGEGGSSSIVFKADWCSKIVAFVRDGCVLLISDLLFQQKCFKTRALMSDQHKFDEFEREVEILSSLSHPHVIQFFGACLKPPRVGILMEYCPKGEILEFILRFQQEYLHKYPFPEKIRLVLEICSALEYLHSRNVIHRDLKCENVLISEDNSAKLMDFGMSKVVQRMSMKKTKRIGTSVYMAPELVLSDEYDEKCDIFSLGILIYILMTENPNPYGENVREHQIELKVANDPTFRPEMSVLDGRCHWLKELISSCLLHTPEERKTCKEIRECILSGRESLGSSEEEEEKTTYQKTQTPERDEIDVGSVRGRSSVEEELRLENEKLKLEIEELKKKVREKL